MSETPSYEPDAYEPFRCEVSFVEDRAVIVPRGDIDLSTAPVMLRDALATLALPVEGVIVDLRFVTFMDSSGISAMHSARREAGVHGKEFTLASVPPQPRTVLEITGLAEEFGLAPRADPGKRPKNTAA
jgi:anti-sigma B factor antagonist